ncbi:MAG TPA: TatD family hydrolase [Thermomicrobiales bacterium]|nr:TatD family hydrolase [Thermomicrobiales bacterium]
MELIDTHCHLDDDVFENDLPAVLDHARETGVRRFINIGYEPASWERTLALANQDSAISYALGMHPNSADLWSSETKAALTMLLEREHPVAIGETGLDYFREHADHDAQRQAFRDQLDLARRFRLPVVIHMRGDVEHDIVGVLGDFPDVRTILHSFDGSAGLRDFLLERGDSFGVGGLMTRAGSAELRAVLRSVPLESIVLETDSPYLAPKGIKDRRNTPASVAIVAAALADLIGKDIADIAKITTQNALSVFGLARAAVVGGTT